MRYYVEVGGEEIAVELHREPNGTLWAEVEGNRQAVDLSVLDPEGRYSILLEGRSYDVVLERADRLDRSKVRLGWAGRRFDLRVEDERQRAARRIAGARPRGPSKLVAMMPGIVRAVLVEVGQEVEEGQPLLILEAMKMENELCADQAGVVQEILVPPGTPVEGGAPLVLLAAAPGEPN